MFFKFKRIALKVGSNVITRADGTLDITRMSALVDQIAFLHKQGIRLVLLEEEWNEYKRVLLSILIK